MSAKYYSEFGEDRWISENLVLPGLGFYVDVGAAHPVAGSNTAFLRDRGWHGLAIDANPGYAEHWAGISDCHFVAAIASDVPIVEFDFKDIPGHSRVEYGAKISFAATRMDTILRARGVSVIDVLSLDLEGHEFNALLSMQGYWPRIVISEFSTAGLPDDYRVRDLLIRGGYYELRHTTHSNHIFVRKSRHEKQ